MGDQGTSADPAVRHHLSPHLAGQPPVPRPPVPLDLASAVAPSGYRRLSPSLRPSTHTLARRLRNLDLSCEPSRKKCKFVVKLGASTDIRRAEDLTIAQFQIHWPQRLVLFASTSNTTLNAHIDQCLSVESNAELVETFLVKPEVKPRKKRLMADIYKTALPYTLEDLDWRNGTNWAVELAIVSSEQRGLH